MVDQKPGPQLDAVKRISEVFDYLMEHPEGVSISELSRVLGYHKSVVHRLLKSLEAHSYVKTDETHHYQLGTRVLQLGLVALQRLDLRRLARPRLERIWSFTHESVMVTLKVGDSRVHIDGIESPQAVKRGVEIGKEAPFYLGVGKVFLAFLPEQDQERILASIDGVVKVDGSPVSVDVLKAELQLIRQRGYTLSVSERRAGVFGIAAPVFNDLGSPVALLVIGGPTSRLDKWLPGKFSPMLLREAESLSYDLGYNSSYASFENSHG
ncbi:MAG: IclR family transcriptional regulator [Chloroflexi bacterium]|jgi:IclR family KDG regulon transcriptional repressor|nr:IclR family transcriptional regulator [Chloroflexota bacterium]